MSKEELVHWYHEKREMPSCHSKKQAPPKGQDQHFMTLVPNEVTCAACRKLIPAPAPPQAPAPTEPRDDM